MTLFHSLLGVSRAGYKGVFEASVSGPRFQGWYHRKHRVEPVGTLGERAAFRRDGVPRDRVGGQRHPRQAPACAGLQKGAKGERGWRSGNGQGEEREPDGGIGVAAERIGLGDKEHGTSGGGLFCRPGGNFTRGRDIGKCQVLPEEKGKVPAGKNRPRVALSVPQVHRTERKV